MSGKTPAQSLSAIPSLPVGGLCFSEPSRTCRWEAGVSLGHRLVAVAVLGSRGPQTGDMASLSPWAMRPGLSRA